MPKVSEMLQSKYLRKEDIDDDTHVTIRGVKLEDIGIGDNSEQKWVIYYKEFTKGHVLNVTTIRILEAAFGDETDNWKGKQIMLYVDPSVSFQGRVVGGLRVRVPKPSKAAERAPGKPQHEADEKFDEDVPF